MSHPKLHLACKGGGKPNSTLLARGEDQTSPCLQGGGRTKLHLACKGGGKPNSTLLARGRTKLHLACKGGAHSSTYNITFVPRREREDQILSINAPQNDKLEALETEVGPSDICKRDQCIPHNVTISNSASTLTIPLVISIALFSNLQSPVEFSPDNIINFDQMRQYRPKRAIAKSPTWENKCSSKQINTSNYFFHLYNNVVKKQIFHSDPIKFEFSSLSNSEQLRSEMQESAGT